MWIIDLKFSLSNSCLQGSGRSTTSHDSSPGGGHHTISGWLSPLTGGGGGGGHNSLPLGVAAAGGVGTTAPRRDGVSCSPTSSSLHRSNSTGDLELSPMPAAADDVIGGRERGGEGEGEEEMLALTRDVQRFSEALEGLKGVVSSPSPSG